jgi:hypothetical protein
MRDPVRDNHLGRPSTAPDMHGNRTARDQGLLVFICTAEKYCNRAASQTMPDPATIISLRRNLPRLPCQSLGVKGPGQPRVSQEAQLIYQATATVAKRRLNA